MIEENQNNIPQTKALELIATELVKDGYNKSEIKDKLHQAAFLATLESASQTMGSRVTPTPLFRISYDYESSSLEFNFLEGKGLVPEKSAVDIDYADFVFASFKCDRVALLSEGITGTGKTYTLEQVLKTVYAQDNRRGIRLNTNMSNVLQPYIEGRVDPNEGVLRININKNAVREIAALFIDEQNRGDTNAILGLLDNQVVLATGERAELGLPIPQIDINGNDVKVHFKDEKVKPVAVHSAQNPPDPEYSGARRTDGAVGNRQVRINYPNMALHSGAATINMTEQFNHHHENFMDLFTSKFANYLNIDTQRIKELLLPQNSNPEEKDRANQEYLNIHAVSFDPANSQNLFLRSAVENADHIIMLTGGNDLESNFNDELEIAQQWTDELKHYGVNFVYNTTIDTKSQLVLRIEKVRSAFNESLIERDKTKATKIADALALITRYKKAYEISREQGTSPLDEFKDLQAPLTVRDIASAYAIVLNDKVQTKNGTSPVSVINQAFTDYVGLLGNFSSKVYDTEKKFDLTDPNQSVRYLCSYLAVNAVKGDQDLKADEYASKMIEELNKTSALLRGLDDGNDTKKLLVARVNSDIASLAGFIHQYRRDIAEAFNQVGVSDKVMPRYVALTDVVKKARNEVKTNYTLPRVERVFGI